MATDICMEEILDRLCAMEYELACKDSRLGGFKKELVQTMASRLGISIGQSKTALIAAIRGR